MKPGETRYYPTEICLECGNKHGKARHGHAVGMWNGTCGWCEKKGPVCAPRDFLYPAWKPEKPSADELVQQYRGVL